MLKVMTWNVENLFRPTDVGPTTEPVYQGKLHGRFVVRGGPISGSATVCASVTDEPGNAGGAATAAPSVRIEPSAAPIPRVR
jgi:hypothetical protein